MFHLMLVAFPFLVAFLVIYGIYFAFRPHEDEPDIPASDECNEDAGSEKSTAEEQDGKAQGTIDLTVPFLIIFILLAIAGTVFFLHWSGWIFWIEWICSLIL